ncbi:MAG TPA: thioredoxin family protein [Candidatus Polarisedimenticolia bacterium]|nr:thioredoxin family protein [Candidatus Polarisedimenticolia bacterium]
MKRILLCATAAAVSLSAAFALGIGDKAPSTRVKMKNVDGRELSIKDVAGEKGTLVVFSCNHCPYVTAWQERIAAIGNAAMERSIGVIVINSNDPKAHAEDGYEQMRQRAGELRFNFPYVVDKTSDVARNFGATRTPESFLFSKEGTLVYHGAIDDSHKPANVQQHYLKDAIEALVSGKNVRVKETKSVGCSIKFRESK